MSDANDILSSRESTPINDDDDLNESHIIKPERNYIATLKLKLKQQNNIIIIKS